MDTGWATDPSSNKLLSSFLVGYMDISGGDIVSRNGNIIGYLGDISMNGNLTISKNSSLNGNLYVNNDISTNGGFFVSRDISLNGNITIGGNINIGGNISLPNNQAGITGPTGAYGVGPTGITGPTGAIGLQGPKGADGSPGTNGLTGPQGNTGLQGNKGDKGDKGDTGPQGNKGDKGDAGPQGTSPFVTSGSNVYYNAGGVSIGSNILTANISLDVTGNIRSTGDINCYTINCDTIKFGLQTFDDAIGSYYYVKYDTSALSNYTTTTGMNTKFNSYTTTTDMNTKFNSYASLTTMNNSDLRVGSSYTVTAGAMTAGTMTAGAFNATSDHRIKYNVKDVLLKDTFSLDNLRPVSYLLNDDSSKKNHIGFIAHEVQEYFPELVSGEKDAVDTSGIPVLQSINYIGIIPLLVREIQVLKKRVELLERI